MEENNGEYTIKDKNGQIGNEIINILIVDKIIKCNIEFISEDEVVSSQVVDYFGFAQGPDNPSKESTVDKYYTFSHWALTEDGNAVDISTYEINGDKKFYAVFEENYKEFELDIAYLTNIDISVNVTRNDEILGTYTSEDNVQLRYGDIIEVIASAHDGYSVLSILVDGATAVQDGRYIVNGSGKIIISASDKVENCEVTFISEGDIVSTQTIQYGQYVEMPENPEKADTDAVDYTFSHWSLTENGESVDLLSTPIKSLTVTFYAVFTSVEWDYVLNVDYSDNITTVINVLRGGESFQITKSSSQADRKLRFGDVLEIVNTPNEGYELTNVIVTGEIVENNGKYVVTNKDGIVGDGTISVAITEKITKCNVQFVSNGSIYDEQEVNYFGNPILPSAPTKEDTSELDYTFSHWSLSENGEAVDVANYEITGDKVFYAVFSSEYWDYVIDITPASHITTKLVVTRDGNTFEINSSSTLSERSLRYGDTFEVVNTLHEGYNLSDVVVTGEVNESNGKYTVANKDGIIGDGTITIVISEEIIKCNVQFISEGNVYNEQEINYFEYATIPSNPTKDSTKEYSYIFSHWSTTEGGSAEDVATYQIKGNATFYAVFDEIFNNVTLNIDGVESKYATNAGDNILTTMSTLNTDVTDYNSCGYFYDENLTQVVGDDDVFEDGKEITLYTKMATLDKITITDGVVMANDTSISGEVVIPKSATSIGEKAFYNCSLITSVVIPSHVETIGSRAFTKASVLETINVIGGNVNLSSQDGVLFNNDQTILIAYPAGKTDLTYSIPSGVKILGEYSFRATTYLNTINIPSSVEVFELSTFHENTSLVNVNIANNSMLTTIGERAFYSCSNLESFVITANVGFAISDKYAISLKLFIPISTTKAS